MPAKYVRAFLKGNKNDYRDAEAIAEAMQRPPCASSPPRPPNNSTCRPYTGALPSRQRAHGDCQRDRGIAVSQGLHRLREALPDILATRTDLLAPRLPHILEDLIGDWRRLYGMVSPGALAVLRLISSSNLVGCSTGRSAGLAPLSIRVA